MGKQTQSGGRQAAREGQAMETKAEGGMEDYVQMDAVEKLTKLKPPGS